jgi:hypothetical protein
VAEWSGFQRKVRVYLYLTNGDLLIAQIIVALADFMADKDFAALASMYTLFARVSVTKSLCDAFRNHIRVCTSSFIMTDH